MILLLFSCSDFLPTVLISLFSSAIFASSIYAWRRYSNRIKLKHNIGVYIKNYAGKNKERIGQTSVIAQVEWCDINELKIVVQTLINEHTDQADIFDEASIQEWQGMITMDNKEAGKLYCYFTRPIERKQERRSGFYRVLFLHNFSVLKLFGEHGVGENKWGEEILYKKELL
jgi:hypothetical protein